MVTADIETFSFTPTFGALLPVLLDARVNIGRKLSATQCDGFEDGWCSVHNYSYPEVTETREDSTLCDYWREPVAVRSAWKVDLQGDLDSVNAELAKMAKLADLFGPARQTLDGLLLLVDTALGNDTEEKRAGYQVSPRGALELHIPRANVIDGKLVRS
jgi:hypothetical protein